MGAGVLAAAPIVTTLIGTGVMAYGQMQAADARSQQANYQAQIALNDQKISEQNARYAEAATAAQVEQNSLKTRSLVGEAAAASASSGLDVNSGSPLAVRSSIAALGELSGLTIRNSGARQAYGYRVQGENYGATAGLYEKSAADSSAAGDLATAGTLLGGLTSAGNMTVKDYQAGLFPLKLTS